MKRVLLFFIVFITMGYGQSINNFSLALGGEIANRFDQDSPNVYSGVAMLRYRLPDAGRIGVGFGYTHLASFHRQSYYIQDGLYMHRATLDTVKYLKFPVFYEHLLSANKNRQIYLSVGLQYKYLLSFEWSAYDTVGPRGYGEFDTVKFFRSTGLAASVGINFRQLLSSRLALNIFPYIELKLNAMYDEYIPGIKYGVLMTEDKTNIGVRVSLEGNFSEESVENYKERAHWELGAFAGDETGFEVIFGNKWLVEHSAAYYDMLGRQERNNVYVRYSYGFSFRHGIRRRFLIGNHLGVVPFLGLRYILLRDLYFNSQGNEYLYPLLGQKNLYMGGRMEYLIKDKYILFGEVTVATLYKIQLLGKFGVAFKTKKL